MYIQDPLMSWHSWPVNGQDPKLLENPMLLTVLLEEGLELAIPLLPQTAPLIKGTSAAPLFLFT